MSMSRKLTHKTSNVEKEQDKLTACRSSASDGRNRLEEGGEEFVSLTNQLQALGLKLREVPGDGNCLFRALGDQLEGHSRGHLRLRQETVQYMQAHRQDFEPFVEDEIPFTEYLSNLSQQGTFAGNDAIVAFARSHQLRIIIHQLNTPMWEINASDKSAALELHIAFRYGDHYDSVRLIGDNSESPARLRIEVWMLPLNSSRFENFNILVACHENLDRSMDQCAVWQLRHRQSASPPTHSRDEDMILRRLSTHSPSGLAESRRQHRAGPEALTVPQAALWEVSGTGARIFGPVATAEDSDGKLRACRSKLADKVASKERKESQWPERKKRQEDRQSLKEPLSRAPQDQNQSDRVTVIPAFNKLSI